MKSILVFTDWFAPAYKAGGPIRSCVNFAYAMSDTFNVYVITGDTDHGDKTPLKGIKVNSWQTFEINIQVMYLDQSMQNIGKLRTLIQEVDPDFLYLNSMFSKVFTIFPLLINRSLKKQIVLSPRGMLKSSALNFKPLKKKLFLFTLKSINAFSRSYFHATDKQEKQDIINRLSIDGNRIVTTGNFPKANIGEFKKIDKKVGHVRLVYVSRIAAIKNLHVLLDCMQGLTNIQLDIYGPKEDDYWVKCQRIIDNLDSSNQVNYLGSVPNEEVGKKIQNAHFFVLPTLGENFGHAIFEAFAAGRPVIISDQTPWKELDKINVGWDLSLDDLNLWLQTLETVIKMDNVTFQKKCKESYTFALNYISRSALKSKYLELFS